MSTTMVEFQHRMRSDRAFRQRILSARRDGTLVEVLAQEGYELDMSMPDIILPQVRTNLHGGQCYCMIISEEGQRK